MSVTRILIKLWVFAFQGFCDIILPLKNQTFWQDLMIVDWKSKYSTRFVSFDAQNVRDHEEKSKTRVIHGQAENRSDKQIYKHGDTREMLFLSHTLPVVNHPMYRPMRTFSRG